MRDDNGKRKEKKVAGRGQQHFGSWRSLSDICSANITLPCFYQSQVSKLP